MCFTICCQSEVSGLCARLCSRPGPTSSEAVTENSRPSVISNYLPRLRHLGVQLCACVRNTQDGGRAQDSERPAALPLTSAESSIAAADHTHVLIAAEDPTPTPGICHKPRPIERMDHHLKLRQAAIATFVALLVHSADAGCTLNSQGYYDVRESMRTAFPSGAIIDPLHGRHAVQQRTFVSAQFSRMIGDGSTAYIFSAAASSQWTQRSHDTTYSWNARAWIIVGAGSWLASPHERTEGP